MAHKFLSIMEDEQDHAVLKFVRASPASPLLTRLVRHMDLTAFLLALRVPIYKLDILLEYFPCQIRPHNLAYCSLMYIFRSR